MTNANLKKIVYKPLRQIIQIITLLSDSPGKYNIISLSNELNIPVGLSRNIIDEIANSQTIFHVYIGNEAYYNIRSKNEYLFLAGHYDTYALSIKSKTIIVNPDELIQYKTIFQSYKHNSLPEKISIPECIVKGEHQTLSSDLNAPDDIIRRLRDAFVKKRTLLCEQKNGSSIYPIALYHDALTSKAFCVTLSEKMITFHPIDQLRISKEVDNIYSENEISATLDLLKHIWSPHPISLDTKPTLYRIMIKKEPNTIEKIRHDVANYDATFIEQSNGCHLLEINVISSESFISWLLGYGSSITVLLPLDAREKIISIYKNVLKKNS